MRLTRRSAVIAACLLFGGASLWLWMAGMSGTSNQSSKVAAAVRESSTVPRAAAPEGDARESADEGLGESRGQEMLSRKQLEAIAVKTVPPGYQLGGLNPSVAEMLDLTAAERERVDQLVAETIEDLKRLEIASAEFRQDSNHDFVITVSEYWDEGGRLVADRLRESVDEILGTGRGRIMTASLYRSRELIGNFGLQAREVRLSNLTSDGSSEPRVSIRGIHPLSPDEARLGDADTNGELGEAILRYREALSRLREAETNEERLEASRRYSEAASEAQTRFREAEDALPEGLSLHTGGQSFKAAQLPDELAERFGHLFLRFQAEMGDAGAPWPTAK